MSSPTTSVALADFAGSGDPNAASVLLVPHPGVSDEDFAAAVAINASTSTAALNRTTSAEIDFVFEFFCPGILLNGIGSLGLVGNLISIFILSRPQMKGSTNCILIGLATYDIILIVTR